MPALTLRAVARIMKRMAAVLALGLGSVPVACSTEGGTCVAPGGPVTGAADTHCIADDGGAITTAVDPAACHADAAPDGGATTDYGPTRDGTSADDDDCKYHVSWTSTAVCEGPGVVFTIVATNKSDGTPLTSAHAEAEIFFNLTHPSPTPIVDTTEGPPGTYVTQPVKFDEPGEWTVRFHFHEECVDFTDDSPHGHVAFHVQVP